MKTSILLKTAAVSVCTSLLLMQPVQAEDTDVQVRQVHDRDELERHLELKRERMRELAEEMGELSIQLADGPITKMAQRIHMNPDRAVLGVSIESRTGDPGVRVHAVTPDGPAEAAGLEAGDVIVAIGGIELDRDDSGEAAHKLIEVMDDVEVGDAVAVAYERDGKRYTTEVTTEAMGEHASAFAFSTGPDVDFDFKIAGDMFDAEAMEKFAQLGNMDNYAFVWRSGPWADMELVELTPQLGNYFGVDKGLLVVRAPEDTSLGVMDGDVIVRLNGEEVSTPGDFTHTLGRGKEGDTVSLDIVRQRGSMTLEALMPQSEEFDPVHINEDGNHVIIKRHVIEKD